MREEEISRFLDDNLSGVKNVSINEFLIEYDLIIKAFMYKYTYETAKLQGNESSVADKNLNDVRVYSKFLNEANNALPNLVARREVLNCINLIKNSNFKKKTVRASYDVYREWLCPDRLKGKIIRNNFTTPKGQKILRELYLEGMFSDCNKMVINEESSYLYPLTVFYDCIKEQYDDLIK